MTNKTRTMRPKEIQCDAEEGIEGSDGSTAGLSAKPFHGEDAQRSDVSSFSQRAADAIERTTAQGDGVPAEQVISKLVTRLRQAQRQLIRTERCD
jgi:hypothetical protein